MHSLAIPAIRAPVASLRPKQNHSSMKALCGNMSRAIRRKEEHLLFACDTDPTIAFQDVVNSLHTKKHIKDAVGFHNGPKSSGTGVSDEVVEQVELPKGGVLLQSGSQVASAVRPVGSGQA
jgi:hypothetical protein